MRFSRNFKFSEFSVRLSDYQESQCKKGYKFLSRDCLVWSRDCPIVQNNPLYLL